MIESAMGGEGALVADRFARGCRCFAARVEDEVAGYGWLSTGPEWIGELQLEIRPERLDAYIWNCVTLEAHRRKGVFTSLLAGITGLARDGGLRRIWIGSLAIPAEKAVAPAGFRPALRFEMTTMGPLNRLRVIPADDFDLALEARKVLGVRLGTTLRRSRRRSH